MTESSTAETLVDRFSSVLKRRADAPLYRFLNDGNDAPEVPTGGPGPSRSHCASGRPSATGP